MTEPTYPPADPVPRFRSQISPQDQVLDWGWTLEGSNVGRHTINLTPIEDVGQRHPSHLDSDVFWAWSPNIQRSEW